MKASSYIRLRKFTKLKKNSRRKRQMDIHEEWQRLYEAANALKIKIVKRVNELAYTGKTKVLDDLNFMDSALEYFLRNFD